MDARHLIGPAARRHRANVLGLFALAGVIGLTTLVLDPSTEQPRVGVPGSGLSLGGPADGGVVLVSTPEESVVLRPDGSLVTVGPDGTQTTTRPPATGDVGSYRAMATASLLYAGEGEEGSGSVVGLSAVNVNSIGTGFTERDRLGAALVADDVDEDAVAVARTELVPGFAPGTAQATSPKPSSDRIGLVDPDSIPIGLTALGGQVAANTEGDRACAAHGRVAEASADLAGGDLFPGLGPPLGSDTEDPNQPVSVVGVDGVASSASLVELTPAEIVDEESHHTPAPAVAVTARAKVRVPTITIFPGTFYKVQVRFLAPIELMATAGGLPGTARAHTYGMVLDQDRPIVALTAYFGTQYLTGRYFQTEHGVRIGLGNGAAIELGASELSAAAGGRSAKGAVDLVRVVLPDRIGAPQVTLDPDLVETLTGYDVGLLGFLEQLNGVLSGVPLPEIPLDLPGAREVRIGHLEVDVSVPPGGVRCEVEEEHVFGIADDDVGHP